LIPIFSHGNKIPQKKERAAGFVLSGVLVGIFLLSVAAGAWYSLMRTRYVCAEKALTAYYAELEARNAASKGFSDETD
jgi:hypothetical protein